MNIILRYCEFCDAIKFPDAKEMIDQVYPDKFILCHICKNPLMVKLVKIYEKP